MLLIATCCAGSANRPIEGMIDELSRSPGFDSRQRALREIRDVLEAGCEPRGRDSGCADRSGWYFALEPVFDDLLLREGAPSEDECEDLLHLVLFSLNWGKGGPSPQQTGTVRALRVFCPGLLVPPAGTQGETLGLR